MPRISEAKSIKGRLEEPAIAKGRWDVGRRLQKLGSKRNGRDLRTKAGEILKQKIFALGMEIIIKKSANPDKKMDAVIDGKRTISFGQKNASDFTINRDPKMKEDYIKRHRRREDWEKSGVATPGFYAKNVLWNKTTVQASIRDMNKRFKGLRFTLQ
jgi:hypothetical protein